MHINIYARIQTHTRTHIHVACLRGSRMTRALPTTSTDVGKVESENSDENHTSTPTWVSVVGVRAFSSLCCKPSEDQVLK